MVADVPSHVEVGNTVGWTVSDFPPYDQRKSGTGSRFGIGEYGANCVARKHVGLRVATSGPHVVRGLTRLDLFVEPTNFEAFATPSEVISLVS